MFDAKSFLSLVAACLVGWSCLFLCKTASATTQTPTAPEGKSPPADMMLGDLFDQGKPGVNPDLVRRKWLDVPYATLSPAQQLDIYLPEEGDGPFPVVVAIHGGSFYRGDKRDFQIVPMLGVIGRGYALVSINYRLSDEARFPSQIHDVKAAIRWIRANAGRYRLDPARVAVWGDSAGGNLAALAGTSGHVAALEDLGLGNADQPSTVRAVVDWYGPVNLLTVADQLKKQNIGKKESPAARLIGKSKEEAPELYLAESPETYITGEAPPFFIQHGDADVLVSVRQSVDFAAKLRKILGDEAVTLEIIKGAGHLDAAFNTPENVDRVLDFLDARLK